MIRRGFTLVEVLLAISLTAIVFLGIGSFTGYASKISVTLNNLLQADQDLAASFRLLVIDIRSLQPSALGGYPIEAATSTSVTFFSDVDQDGIAERVRYLLGTSTLERGIVEPTGSPLTYATSTEVRRVIATDVTVASSSFQYYDASYGTSSTTPLAFPLSVTAIRAIRVTVTVDKGPTVSPKPTIYSAFITPRNLAD
jgi:prepilin-type N-terminal cleavage/methylation domain-containing protein